MFNALRPAWTITWREVRDQFRDWRIIFPIAALTIFFPFLMNFTAQQVLGFVQRYGADIIGERLIPFLLMICGFFPTSFSLVIALESFVGEKERGSIEPLLNSPIKDWQLYLGKLISSTVPPLFGSFLAMSVYLIGLMISDVPIPKGQVMLLIILLTIVQAVMMVAGAVVVSTQATSVRAANLLASFIIIPVALLIQGESIVMFWGDYKVLWLAVLGTGLIAVLLIRVGLAHFQREELLGREIDVLNIKWGLKVFWTRFSGGAANVWGWYRKEVPAVVRSMRKSILFTTLLALAGVFIGTQLVRQFFIPMDPSNFRDIEERLGGVMQIFPVFSIGPVLAILWQNLRVMLVALVLGGFSLGILGPLPMMISMAAVGYILGLLGANGFSMMQYFLGFILPHGIFEIPGAILATAAVLQSGVILATPMPGKTVSEVTLEALADWAKVMLGLVIPLLFIGAAIEAWLTPRLALMLVH